MSTQKPTDDLGTDIANANNDSVPTTHANTLEQDKQLPQSISPDPQQDTSLTSTNHTPETGNTPDPNLPNDLSDRESSSSTKQIHSQDNQNNTSIPPNTQDPLNSTDPLLPNENGVSYLIPPSTETTDSQTDTEPKPAHLSPTPNSPPEGPPQDHDPAAAATIQHDLPSSDNPTSPEPEKALPESIRYSRLVQITQLSVAETVKRLTYKELATCYPTIASTASGEYALQQALTQIQTFFENAALKEFETIYEERNVAYLFHELEVLIKEAYERKDRFEKQKKEAEQKDADNPQKPSGADAPVFLQSLAPESIVSAHLVPYQQSKIAELKQQLANLRKSNQTALEALNTSNSKAQRVLQNIEEIAKDLATKTKPISDARLPSRKEIAKAIDSLTFDNDLLL